MTTRAATDRPPADPEEGRGWSVGRVLAIGVLVALVIFWVWIFSGGPRRDAPDKLADGPFAAQAERTCAAARADIAQLPSAPSADDADDRADVLDAGTDHLDAMVTTLGDRVPEGDDAEVVREWLGDWRAYNDDRRAWADALRDDPDARFLVTEKAGQQITDAIDAFAETNDMDSCATPLDA
ncbi:hypothetical protein BH20ACT2_BH20ACT2_26100 [soil metagenome]